jgi:hypothetical protein
MLKKKSCFVGIFRSLFQHDQAVLFICGVKNAASAHCYCPWSVWHLMTCERKCTKIYMKKKRKNRIDINLLCVFICLVYLNDGHSDKMSCNSLRFSVYPLCYSFNHHTVETNCQFSLKFKFISLHNKVA